MHKGVLIVESEGADAARFIDPIDSVDDILLRYQGYVRLDSDIFVEPEEAVLARPATSATKFLARPGPPY